MEKTNIPVLSLPMKVGVAFVAELTRVRSGANFVRTGASPISEQEKMLLTKTISDNFMKHPFVRTPSN